MTSLNQTTGRIFLRRGKDGPVRGGNPWIFSQAIERREPSGLPIGAAVEVLDASGAAIGVGHFNPNTTIAVRMLLWRNGAESADSDDLDRVIAGRIERALRMRQRTIGGDTNCYRLVNGDGDGLSGLVVDRYHEVLVIQLLSAGMDRMREAIIAALKHLIRPRAIIERSQGAVRRQEGLADRSGIVTGDAPGPAIVSENGVRIEVDFEHGQKTGYFLDQRENRRRIMDLAADARVLDLCCYSGSFAIAAAKGGARETVAVDTSARALEWARRNADLNEIPNGRIELVHEDAGKYLSSSGKQFDLIVLDPPPLARSREQAAHAGRLYVELNAAAMRALAPGGYLMTFSCSTHLSGEDFVRAMRMAQSRAGAQLRRLARLGPGADHPVLLGHVEGEYLTGLLLNDLR
ncbi:MAG: class I SAM-dependent rRNA methyltransferase [Candidatus Binataceae bacterium]|nr:class I SAM-dependent rRNA methyltransferase [Candidatus Binataceae bacterium]